MQRNVRRVSVHDKAVSMLMRGVEMDDNSVRIHPRPRCAHRPHQRLLWLRELEEQVSLSSASAADLVLETCSR
jgi:hypothetical protein